MLYDSINRENLRVLMTIFYEKAVEDEVLAPYFIDELGDDLEDEDWIEHVDLLADFWLAKILGEDTYGGNFIGTHARIPHIPKEVFDIWLEMFSQVADEVYTSEIAHIFKKKAKQLTLQFLNTNLRV